MGKVAKIIVENRVIAALVVSLAAAFPPFGVAGGAAAGLVTLHSGIHNGLLLTAFGAGIAGLLGLVLGEAPVVALIIVAGATLPVCLLAWLLRSSKSLSLTIQIATVGACAVVAGFIWLSADVTAFWRGVLELWLAQAQSQGLGLSSAEEAALINRVPFEVLTGSAAANWLIFVLGALFIARAAQAALTRPGGFGREFRHFVLGKLILGLTIVMLLAYALFQALLPLNITAVLLAGWLLQGLAVLHNLVALYQLSAAWMVVSYGALVVSALIASPLMLFFPALGVLDESVGLRERLKLQRTK